MDSQDTYRLSDELHKAINELRAKLNTLDEQKEAAFSLKQQLGKQIKEHIMKVKQARERRDLLTKEIKELKTRRDSSNKKLQEKIKELGTLRNQKQEKSAKYENPMGLKKDIEALELTIQTESMPFEKEQELMKKIKLMKKAYEESLGVAKAYETRSSLKHELDAIRTEGNAAHTLVQEKAKESQNEHEKLLLLSKEIDAFAAKEEEAYKKFLELKGQFKAAHDELKAKLVELDSVQSTISQARAQKRAKKQEEQDLVLKSKEEVVEEKIRMGKKLTTEDIMILQSRSSEEF